jgi:hypothetical protein
MKTTPVPATVARASTPRMLARANVGAARAGVRAVVYSRVFDGVLV